ncbi:hypothetical protein ACFYY5_29540 [Nocardia elegans]|uniref:Scaffolding protein n=1 Tax=Nocardia elegans TaxID=300029 RepID=A0ABW6TLJ0_9NOCA
MADEATPAQETTTESPVEAPTSVEAVDATPDIGGDVQATETDTPATEPEPSDKAAKSYDESYVRKLRDENAATRIKAKEAETKAQEAARQAQEAADAQRELTEKLGRALGFVQDEKPLTSDELLKQAAEREAQIAAERDAVAERLRNFERREALTSAVTSVDGDLEAILDSRKVNEAIAKLDTNADDFKAQVAEIVSAAVESNPKLKKAPAQVAAPRSGGDLSGGNGAPKPNAEKSIDDLRREKREREKRESI